MSSVDAEAAAAGHDPERDAERLIAIDRIARRHRTQIERFFRARLHSIEDAADLTQDVFVRLARSSSVLEVEQPRPFLYRIATNLLHDRRKSATVRAASVTVPLDRDALACEAPLPDAQLAARQQVEILRRALEELDPRCRAMFVRFRFDNCSQAQIAAEFGVSLSLVEKKLRKALLHCRRRLDQAGGEGTP